MKANGVAEHRCLRYLAAIGELSWRSNRTYRRSMVTVSTATHLPRFPPRLGRLGNLPGCPRFLPR